MAFGQSLLIGQNMVGNTIDNLNGTWNEYVGFRDDNRDG